MPAAQWTKICPCFRDSSMNRKASSKCGVILYDGTSNALIVLCEMACSFGYEMPSMAAEVRTRWEGEYQLGCSSA
jgi:hypothetical protein